MNIVYFLNLIIYSWNSFVSYHIMIINLYYNSRRSSVCVCVCLWPNSSETNGRINFIFGTNVKHTPGIVQIFFGDLRSKVKVTSEVKVTPKIKSAGNLMKRVENWKSHFQNFHTNLTFLRDLVIFDYSGALTSAVFSVEHPQLMREQNTLQIKVLLLR